MPFNRFQRRIRYWFEHRQRAQMLREEMEFHLEMKIGQLKEAGMAEHDARNEARRQFGNITQKAEESRSTWIARWMSDLAQDLCVAARALRKQPGFTAVAVLSAALGIGACSTIFGVVNFALFRPLPVEEPARLMGISSKSMKTAEPEDELSYPDFKDLREARSFSGVAGFFPLLAATISSNGEPQRYWGSVVTANYFDVVRPGFAVGRGFDSAHDDKLGAPPVIVLSHHLWLSRFAADPAIIGKTIEMNKRRVAVTGVTPPGFRGTEVTFVSDFWVPLSMRDELHFLKDMGNGLTDRNGRWLFCLGRLRDGVQPQHAIAESAVIAKRLRAQFPASNQNIDFYVERAGQINPGLRRLLVVFFAMLLCVTSLVLLTACANVANLLLARASARQKEIATRLAIGAGRGRLVRQLLTESVLLALLGGASGFLIAWWAAGSIGKFRIPLPLPVDLSVSLDYHVLLFSLALSVVTGVVFGLAPALRTTKTDLVSALKDDSAKVTGLRRLGLRDILVVTQVAFCMLLLICSGLFLRSLYSSQTMDLGIRNRNLLLAAFDPALNHYSDSQSRQLMEELRRRAEALPGVESASLVSVVPLSLGGHQSSFVPEDKMAEPAKNKIHADIYAVSPRFFDTFGIPFQQGVDFGLNTGSNSDVAIVNQALAEKAFPHQNPIGRRISYEKRMLRISGLVATAKSRTIGEEPRPCLYLPILESSTQEKTLVGTTLAVRTKGDPASYAVPLRQAIHDLDPALAVFDVRTMETHLTNALLLPRLAAMMFGLCGGMGLLISTIGIYGVVSFAVARRTKEIGIRMALGARRNQVLGMVLRQGLVLTAAGCALGIAAALAVSRVAASLLYGIRPNDPVTFVLTPLFLGAVALAACLIPARRAARLDPIRTLRYE